MIRPCCPSIRPQRGGRHGKEPVPSQHEDAEAARFEQSGKRRMENIQPAGERSESRQNDAVSVGDEDEVKLLLKSDVDVNFQNVDGLTPLHQVKLIFIYLLLLYNFAFFPFL